MLLCSLNSIIKLLKHFNTYIYKKNYIEPELSLIKVISNRQPYVNPLARRASGITSIWIYPDYDKGNQQ